MSKRSRSRRKRSFGETMILILSAVIAISMVISLIIVALQPAEPVATPTPLPTWTPLPSPTSEPSPTMEPSPTPATLSLPMPEPTEPATGTPDVTPTITPTATITPSSAIPPLVFAVAGDSRDGPNVYRQVLAAVTGDGSQFLVHVGDMVNKGTEDQWQAFEEIMEGFALPFYPVPGNHDGLNGRLEGYAAYSGAPAAHYSFDRGGIHFTMADSHNGGISAAELAWLREDLAASSQSLKMVFLHHPPFDPDGTDHIMAYGNETFMQLMVEQGVDFVFAGHIHAYAREERDGVTYVITGGAGAPTYGADHPLSYHHYLRVAVQDGEAMIEVVEI